MRDRQYLSSLALFVVALVTLLGGLAAVPIWLGWAGAATLATIAGGFLVWFYWGPRPDVRSGGRMDPRKRPDDD